MCRTIITKWLRKVGTELGSSRFKSQIYHLLSVVKRKWKSVKVLITQSCPTLCNPMNYSPPGSFVHGIPQARILEWVAIPFSRGSSWLRERSQVSCIEDKLFTIWATKECVCMRAKSLQLCPTLCNPTDCSPPDSSVHRTLQARILECVAMPSSRGSSQLRGQSSICYVHLHWQAGSLPLVPPGKPHQGMGGLSSPICKMVIIVTSTSLLQWGLKDVFGRYGVPYT